MLYPFPNHQLDELPFALLKAIYLSLQWASPTLISPPLHQSNGDWVTLLYLITSIIEQITL